MHTAQFNLDADGAWIKASGTVPTSGNQLALVFWSDLDDQTVSRHARSLAAMLPDALVLGCSTGGVIHGRTVRDATICATLITFEHTGLDFVRASREQFSNDSRALGVFLASKLDQDDLAHVLIFAPGLTGNGSRLAKGVAEALPPGVTASGGLAADGERFERTALLIGDQLVENEVVGVGLRGPALHVELCKGGGWEPFGMERAITASDGNRLMTIDGESALGLYERYLGRHARDLPASGHLFPLALREPGATDWVTRTILGIDRDSQALVFGGDVPEGSTVRFMRGTITNLVDGATQAMATVQSRPALSVALLVSCVGRRMLLKQFAEEEIETVADALGPNATVTGFYSYGEFAPGGNAACRLHNQTMTVTILEERE